MSPLIFDTTTKEKIKNLCDYAIENQYTLEDMRKMSEGEKPPVGDNPKHAMLIPVGYRVVFSLEHHPMGACRHISISVTTGQYPSIGAVNAIIGMFGFTHTVPTTEEESDKLIGKFHLYVEAINNAPQYAINIIEAVF